MSIWTYTRELPKEFDSVRGRAVEHKDDCPHKKQRGWPDESMRRLADECVEHGCRCYYLVEEYRGRVLSEGERNGYHDSDFYATVITGENLEGDLDTKSVTWGTTRGWTYFNGCKVDASDELRERYDRESARRRDEWNAEIAREKAELDALTPAEGKVVRVKSKRSKVPFGTVGRVFWFGRSRYDNSAYYDKKYGNPYSGLVDPNHRHPARNLRAYRIGFKDADGNKHWASATVVEVLIVHNFQDAPRRTTA